MITDLVVLDSESLTSDVPLPAVNPNDVKRVWRFICKAESGRQGIEGEASALPIAFSDALIAQQCSSGADVLAVFFRTALLLPLLQQGLLNDWREGDELPDTVFAAAATFPLQNGIESFDPNAFIDWLLSRHKPR